MDHKPLFERINIDSDGLDNLPDGTILRVDRDTRYHNSLYFRKEPSNTGEPWAKLDRADDTGSYVAHLIKGFDKRWRRITDGAVVSADLIRSWSTRISLIK